MLNFLSPWWWRRRLRRWSWTLPIENDDFTCHSGVEVTISNATGQAGSSPRRRCHVASRLAFRLGDAFTSTGRGHREVATRTGNEVMKNAGDVEIRMNLLFLGSWFWESLLNFGEMVWTVVVFCLFYEDSAGWSFKLRVSGNQPLFSGAVRVTRYADKLGDIMAKDAMVLGFLTS